MALQRHGFEAFGHISLIDPVKVNRGVALLQDQLDHLPQVGAWGVAQVRQRLAGGAGQAEQWLPIRPGPHIGRYHLLPQAHHFIAVGIELVGLGGVVVGDQQVATALDQAQHRIVYVQRDQPALDGPEARAQR